MRLRTALLLFIATLFLATGAGIAWLLYTNSGAEWLWSRATQASDGALGTASIRGDVRSGLSFGDVYYRSGDVDISAESVHVTADFRLFPFAVDIRTARLAGVSVKIAAADAQAQPGGDATAVVQRLRLPFSLRIRDLVAEAVAIETPGFTRNLQRLEFGGTWHEDIGIERLRVESDGIDVELEADIDPARELAHVGRVTVRIAPEVTGYHEPLSFTLASEGSHRQLALQLDVHNIDASISGELRHLLEVPEWDLEIAVPRYAWTRDGGTIDIRNLFVRTQGHLDAYTLRADADIEYPGIGIAAVSIDGEGTTENFVGRAVRISGDGVDASGSARVVWSGERMASTDLEIAHFDPAPFIEEWPDGQPIRGAVRAALDEARLDITDSTLEVPGTGARVHVNASLDRASNAVDGTLRWQNLRWPIAGDDFIVKSDAADVSVTGSLDAWTVVGRIDVGTRDMPDGSFDIDGGGSRDGAFARVLDAKMLGGSLAGEVAYSWRGARAWQAALTFASIETAPIVPGWPGRLSGKVDANGTGRPRMIRARLDDVTGVLRGAELRASGGLTLNDGALSADRFSVTHGDSSLRVDGAPQADAGLSFDAVVVGARQYLPEMAGRFSARGVARLTREHPFLSLDLQSDVLEYRDIQFTNLTIKDVREDGQIAGIRLSAEELRAAGRSLSDIEVRASVAEDRQTVEAGIAIRGSRLTLALDGAMDDWRAPATTVWRGALEKLEFALDDQHAVRLVNKPPMVLSMTEIDLGRACLGGGDESRLCVESHWNTDGHFSAKAALLDVPVGLLEHFTNFRLAFDQVLNGSIEWAYRPETGPSGSGNLLVRAGHVTSMDDAALELATGDGSIAFDIEDNRLLSGALVLPLPGTGEIHGSFVIEDIGEAMDSPISGDFHLDIAEIAIMSQLLPQIDSAGGRLITNVRVGGTVSAPLMTGELRIEDGSLEYSPIGLRLADVDLEGRLDENYRGELRGTFAAGEGRGEIDAFAEYADFDRPRLQVDLRGENLLLVDVPDVRMTITPSVRFGLEPELLTINGAVLVPMARVTPVNLSTSRVFESQDVEIVAGELPDPVEISRGNGLRYGGSLGVALGDNIIIDLDLARARVTGLTRFDWKGDAMPFAHGRYDISGTISAFGQVLDISEGSVRFPGVRADNPLVRIHAEREIYGNTQIKRAGVLVDGPLKRPSVEAYTQPLTTEERALTLLVTGSDFDYEQGVGAIDFGTYIAPRLFMSYGVGVFERENIISARFDLSKSFGIKASSGSKESGVDLNYRFEN